MVNTRASQPGPKASQSKSGKAKRRRSENGPPTEDLDTQEPPSKTQKTRGRRFATPDEQLKDELEEASERADSEGPLASSPPATNLIPQQSQHFYSLETARRTHWSKEGSDGVENGALSTQDTTVYDPADPRLPQGQLVTPGPSFSSYNHLRIPIPEDLRATPNVVREEKIREYELAIETATKDSAAHAAALEILTLSVQQLGFGAVDVKAVEICRNVRIAFDQARLEVSELYTQGPDLFNGLQNEEVLLRFVEYLRGLLVEVRGLEHTLEGEREEVTSLSRDLRGTEEKLVETTGQMTDLEAVRDGLDNTITQLESTIALMNEDHVQATDNLQHEHADQLAALVEELEREHGFRLTVEDELADQITEFSKLQLDFENAKVAHEQEVEKLAAAEELRESLEVELAKANASLEQKDADTEDLASQIEDLEGQVDQLRTDIQTLKGRCDNAEALVLSTQADLNAANLENDGLKKQAIDAAKEINKLRSDLDGLQHKHQELIKDRDETQDAFNEEVAARQNAEAILKIKSAAIGKLEETISALNSTMRKLEQSKDAEIERKKAQLDNLDEELEQTREDHANAVEEKDGQIEELGEKVHQLTSELEAAKETIDLLQTQVDDLASAGAAKDGELVELKDDLAASQRHANKVASDLETRNADLKTVTQNLAIRDADLATRTADLQIVTEESLNAQEERNTLQKTLTIRDKEVAVLKALAGRLIAAAKKDSSDEYERALRKSQYVQTEEAVLAGLGGAVNGVQVTTKTTRVTRKRTTALRDSGFVGSDDVEEGGDAGYDGMDVEEAMHA